MNTKKIIYLNDEKKDIRVRVNHCDLDITKEMEFITVKPQELKVFEVRCRDNTILFIKRWYYDVMMISSVEENAFNSNK